MLSAIKTIIFWTLVVLGIYTWHEYDLYTTPLSDKEVAYYQEDNCLKPYVKAGTNKGELDEAQYRCNEARRELIKESLVQMKRNYQ